MSLALFGPKFRFHGLFLARSDLLLEAAKLLREAALDFPGIAGPCTAIHGLTGRSEKMRHEIAEELSLTSIRSPDREEVHLLSHAFTFSFKSIKGIASRLALFRLAAVPPSIREITENLVEMSTQVRSMLEVINRGERPVRLSAAVEEIREELDRFLLVGLGELYESNPCDGAEMIEIIKCAQLYDRLEEAVDCTQQITAILEAIILKSL